MRCIFCRCQSDGSKSIEHTVPESLGNTIHILPRGSVCDSCNNYFARKVEHPVLSHRSFRNLRAWNGIRSKAGRPPWLLAKHLSSGFEVALLKEDNGDLHIKAERGKNSDEILRHLDHEEEYGLKAFSVNLELDPPTREMSRLLAKIALERCFSDFLKTERASTDLIFDPYFDNIRRWARNGDNFPSWPYHQRSIYPQETSMRHPKTNEWVKAGIGQGLFHTASPETYYSISLYGIEFVINVGGPNIEGLERWLLQNDQASPYLRFSGLHLLIDNECGQLRYLLDKDPSNKPQPC
jgi:HNH endonuclease